MTTAQPQVSTMQRWRVGLVVLGLILLLIGAITLVNDVPPSRYLGIAAWLLGALVVHDGVIALTVFGASVILRKTTAGLPLAVVAIAQGALVIGGVITILVLPEIVKRAIGTANPTILPMDYLVNLLGFYLALAAATTVVVAAYLVIAPARRLGGTR